VVIGGSAAFLTDSSEDLGRIDYGQALLIKIVALFALMLLLWLSVLEKGERQRFERWVRSRGRSGGSAASSAGPQPGASPCPCPIQARRRATGRGTGTAWEEPVAEPPRGGCFNSGA
jgi:hypothetical protein